MMEEMMLDSETIQLGALRQFHDRYATGPIDILLGYLGGDGTPIKFADRALAELELAHQGLRELFALKELPEAVNTLSGFLSTARMVIGGQDELAPLALTMYARYRDQVRSADPSNPLMGRPQPTIERPRAKVPDALAIEDATDTEPLEDAPRPQPRIEMPASDEPSAPSSRIDIADPELLADIDDPETTDTAAADLAAQSSRIEVELIDEALEESNRAEPEAKPERERAPEKKRAKLRAKAERKARTKKRPLPDEERTEKKRRRAKADRTEREEPTERKKRRKPKKSARRVRSRKVEPVRTECPRCERRIKAHPRFAGKRVRCPSCAGAVRIPDPILELDSELLRYRAD